MSAVEAVVPTFSECVIGYRRWNLDDDARLWPVSSARQPWAPGINTARCHCVQRPTLKLEATLVQGQAALTPAAPHAAPQPDCDCGLYAWHRPPGVWRDEPDRCLPPRVIGAVASWGALQVHAGGHRAEHACVVALAHHPATATSSLAILDQVAARYRVKLVALDDLEQEAGKHGTPLSNAAIPHEPSVSDSPVDRSEPAPVAPAPDASVEEVPPAIALGFDGRPLYRSRITLLYGNPGQ